MRRPLLTVGSLFSGIGGLDLGLERAGMSVAWQSEINPYACRVLTKHWPDVPNLGDITKTDWSTVEPVDLICGGYPCQPFSQFGLRRGDRDPRHLWPLVADAISVLRPRFVLLENVAGHLSLGFGQVLGDLAELGFDAEWDCIPASFLGAPHIRKRVFIVGCNTNRSDGGEVGQLPILGRLQQDANTGRSGSRNWWTTEPDVGRVADGVPNRMDRLHALGNAVVPQVAEFIGRQLIEQLNRKVVAA